VLKVTSEATSSCLDPLLEIEHTWQRVTDWDDLHALKRMHDHVAEIQMMTLHRMYLLAIGEASLRGKKAKGVNGSESGPGGKSTEGQTRAK
jgi:hypothetical protein